ncbi:activating signal cointegrator 1 complex subunit 1-like isoform X2 [Sitodiplosis mosellana]|uniref:activating signal cointegrator 1 complex subunit 1-like isoform X2 n=1 Tax=Sitodiplosis mosellana TaxID=263140 RepID=UPI00244535C9|nr:activating signal cointegrator 1 complex subunit 1-like isoform X2 [Sitodiplosis mosellana]
MALKGLWQLTRKISTIRVLSSAKEALKKRIQDETQTTITCSKVKSDGTSKRVEVKGTNHKDVYTARQQIKSFGNVGPKRELPTHFTCVKITEKTIKENFMKFKEDILNKCSIIPDLHESIFMRPEKLHLTFGVMCLAEDENCQRAKLLLADCLEKIVEPIKTEYGKIEMNIRGVEIIKGRPNKARVVYAKVESEPLQKIANGIAKSFVDAGLAKKEDDRDIVKLHMTLLNVKYLKKAKNKSFDAKHILEQYADFVFGSQEVNHIHLVLMSQKDDDGFYKCIARIEF